MRRLGSRYVLRDLLDRGAGGDVWRGTRVDDDTEIAVKVLRPDHVGDPMTIDRFLHDYSALVELDGPNIVQVHDLIVDGDTAAVVTDLVDGLDLRTYLHEYGPMPPSRAVDLTLGVLDALAEAHAAGILHRDVKPENILVEPVEPGVVRAKLTDFGVATVVRSEFAHQLPDLVGTPTYLAPELTGGEPPTPAADIYAAGAVLYEMLCGRPPFSDPHPMGLLRAHREDPPPAVPGLPPALADVLATMLAKSPRSRPPSAPVAADALLTAAREDSRHHDLDLVLERCTDELVGLATRGQGPPAARGLSLSPAPSAFDESDDRTVLGPPAARGTDEAQTRLTAEHRVATAPGRQDESPTTGFWTAGGGGFVTPALPDGNTTGSSRSNGYGAPDDFLGGPPGPGRPAGWPGGPASDHDEMSQTMLSGALIDPAEASTGPLPHIPRTDPAGGPNRGTRPGNAPRRKTGLVAVATAGVLLVAGLGGWALTSAPGGGSTPDTARPPLAKPGVADVDALFPTGTGSATALVGGTQNGQPISAPARSATPRPSNSSTAEPSPTDAAGPSPSPSPTQGTVPNVVGRKLAGARKAITDAGFGAPSTATDCRSGNQPGEVFGQSPAGGSTAALSTTIQLNVQKDDCADLPEVTGQPVGSALTTVRNAGFTATASPATCQNGPGRVESMFPWGGRSQSKSQTVTLSVKCPDAPAPTSSNPSASPKA